MNKSIKLISYFLITSFLIFLCVEVALRLLGYAPYHNQSAWKVDYIRPDSLKGWGHIPGKYELAINSWGDTSRFVILKNGERATKPNPLEKGLDKVLLIGGSFTMGFGLDDEQTFAWKLQQKFPLIDFRNLGVAAYGTLQSLLVLEEQLKSPEKPKAVIYGFVDHHRYRNVALYDWLHAIGLARKQSEFTIKLPFVSLGEDERLITHKPTKAILIPFSENLAISFMLQRGINRLGEGARQDNANKITELLILKMQELCRKYNVAFYINVLLCEESYWTDFTAFLDQNEILFIDSNIPLNENNTFKDDGHPKEVVQDEWTTRIGQRLLLDSIVSIRKPDGP